MAEQKPDWLDSIPNDGVYEYTMSTDCDGDNPIFFRRTPRYITPAGAFVEITAQQFNSVANGTDAIFDGGSDD